MEIADEGQSLSDWIVLQPHVEFVEARRHGARIRLDSAEPACAADLLARMIKDGLKVVEFHKQERNLEDAFIDIVGRLDQGADPLPNQPPPFPPPFLRSAVSSRPAVFAFFLIITPALCCCAVLQTWRYRMEREKRRAARAAQLSGEGEKEELLGEMARS